MEGWGDDEFGLVTESIRRAVSAARLREGAAGDVSDELRLQRAAIQSGAANALLDTVGRRFQPQCAAFAGFLVAADGPRRGGDSILQALRPPFHAHEAGGANTPRA